MLKHGFSSHKICNITKNQSRSVTVVPLETKPEANREKRKLHAYFKQDVPTPKAERWSMNHQLEVLARVQQLNKMEELFKQMARTVGHDAQTFIAMIHAYTDNGDVEGIERLLKIMKKEKVRPTENFYMRLIQAYQTLNFPEKISSVLSEMESVGIKFRVKSINQLMHIYSLNKNYSAALRLFEQMEPQQILPNKRTYNTLLLIYLKQGNMEQVSNVLNMMREKDLPPDTFAFNILLSETLSSIRPVLKTIPGVYDRVNDILALMRRFKVPIKMSTIVTILRFWITKAHDIYDPSTKEKNEEEASKSQSHGIMLEGEYDIKPEARSKILECVKIVNEQNINWTPEYFRYLILFYTSERKIDVATIHELLEEMAKRDMVPTRAEFHYLLSCMVKFEPDNVNSILSLMAKFKVKPTGKTYAILMCLDEMNFVAVETIAKDMKESGVTPDHAFYYQYIRLAIKNNRDDKVPEILTEMGKAGLVFDRFISKMLFKELIKTNAPYVANVDLLMREFVQLGDLEAAEEFIINLMDSNVSFNLINVSNLIKAHLNQGNEGYALHLSVYFIKRYRTNPLPEFQNYHLFQIYYRTIKLMQSMNVSAMQAYRLKAFKDYILKVPPHLWDEQTLVNFFSLLESVHKDNYNPQPPQQPKRIESNSE